MQGEWFYSFAARTGTVLLYGRQRIALDTWPVPEDPPLKFASEVDFDPLGAGDWPASRHDTQVFKLTVDGIGKCIRRYILRPGGRYVLVSDRLNLRDALPDSSDVTVLPLGHAAQLVVVPTSVPVELRQAIESLGLVVGEQLSVTPIGITAASWDGDGQGVWLEGEQPILRVTSSDAWGLCAFQIDDGESLIFEGPSEASYDVDVCLGQLPLGTHRLEITLLTSEGRQLQGQLQITIRERHDRVAIYSPITVLPDPSFPTFSDIWDGVASLDVLEPGGFPVKPIVQMNARDAETPLFTHRLPAFPLPISKTDWLQMARRVRADPGWTSAVDRAAYCLLLFDGGQAGCASLRLERELVLLVWRVETDRGNDGFHCSTKQTARHLLRIR
jgi:hypothetical protein